MKGFDTELTHLLNIKYPIIMAPMFLINNVEMMIAAMNEGIAACIPAHNFRTDTDFRKALDAIRNRSRGCMGVNLIVNRSNLFYEEQLQTCLKYKMDFIITSLGSPVKVINACKPLGIKVLTDVIDAPFAKKCESLGADALIAVNNEAGGHLGPLPPKDLIQQLRQHCSLPVISAGGVGLGKHILEKLEWGACGVSIGSPFIATTESPVSPEYKQACIDYGANDIVVSTKISGTPCTVINTPYVQKIGTKQNWFEAILSRNKTVKKWIKMLTFYKGMQSLEKAAFKATYKNVWVAGKTIEYTKEIMPVAVLIKKLIQEMEIALDDKINPIFESASAS